MSLDQRTFVATQISAAVACNALAALRLAVSEAANVGLSPEEIKEIIALAKDIQQQPISHAAHLADQLLREPKKPSHDHGANCGCGSHHA
ncbi:conserved exported hypothetical protein [Candidatus Desulfosporosinus infrequens]|uniref:Carboxymuconolactone decarboxylase-like domain-containing protein n=1 Tax=Candidatus Desulfosporosinus infrequens TaxID=2043169 RepID=A0A2U3KZP8_9FIRM|nr:conserved exported hypothetical protein [Candidatus Desulfosporosinus infrequens]